MLQDAQGCSTSMSGGAKMANELMTAEEVAGYLRVKSSTVYEWARRGKIPAAKLGRLWRLHREEVDTWVRNGGVQGTRGLPSDDAGRGSSLTRDPEN